MGTGAELAIVSLVMGAYAAKKNQVASDYAADAAEHREKLEQKRAEISTARERTKQVR
ncbi:MAG: hypothetical protein GY829_13995, partial [Gammaproteobacteria bacterium]|nr:hypothetical protein [Gammaproteobacteria bacterium]